jgi:ubiquitin-activating enzyme E1
MAQIDESLYSRQLYVYGTDAMKSMRLTHILIKGTSGLAIEIAKNLILSGINVTLADVKKQITLEMISSNYFLNEQDIGKSNDIIIPRIAELNPNVQVSFKELDNNHNCKYEYENLNIIEYDIIIAVSQNLHYEKFNNLNIHFKNIKYILCDSYGLFGSIFCDFGSNFIINDVDGEELKSGVINNISFKNNKIIVETVEPHNLTSDDIIMFDDIKKEQIIYIDKTHFYVKSIIPNASRFTQVKNKVVVSFKDLITSLNKPSINHIDFCNELKAKTIHELFKLKCTDAFDNYQNYNQNSLDKIIQKLENNPNVDINLVRKYAQCMDGQLVPINSIIGSIVAQEAIKACTHKYTPIHQWLHFEASDLLLNNPTINYDINSRYINQEKIFGNDLQNNINDSNIFVVGSGAIGCEHLKNFSMMGCNLIVTDMDTIERSNLSRQFLFRNTDIGKLKSVVACEKAKTMNPNIKIVAHQNKVDNNTLNVYNEQFFNGITCITNALDNVSARLFVDSLCIMHKKPLIESGTLGTKCNVQTIIPYLTESYGSSVDPPEQSIPICTLKNFPYLIEHTIQWAKDLFQGLFTNGPQNTIKYMTDNNYLKNLPSSELIIAINEIKKILSNVPSNFQNCLDIAYNEFHNLFVHSITNLLKKFPIDLAINDIPFWSGSKKCPTIINFDIENENHLNFVINYALLWGIIYGIDNNMNYQDIITYIKEKKDSYQITSNFLTTHYSANEDEEKKYQKELEEKLNIDELIKTIPSFDSNITIYPIEFEKDDDSNHHIDFITSVSNLRASIYSIPTIDKFKTKGIAGKIIPAIATTTSLVSGLVGLELYKIILKDNYVNKLETYKNWFCNLALSYIGYSEPIGASKQKLGDNEITFWDSFIFKNPTINDLILYFNQKYNLDTTSITYDHVMLFSPLLMPKKQMERKQKTIETILKELSIEITSNPLQLTVLLSKDDDENDYENNVDSIETITCKIYF